MKPSNAKLSGHRPCRSGSQRARAWTAALAGGIALAWAATAAATPVTVDWDVLTWSPAGNTNLSETYAIGNGNFTVTFTGNTAGLDQAVNGPDNAPDINQQNTGGIVPAQDALYIATDYADNSSPNITITYDFTGYPGGVGNFSFTAFDIDAAGSFIDEMTVTAETPAGTVNPTSIVSGVANSDDGVNTATGSTSAGSSSSDGNVTFTFAQTGITRITIIYRNQIGGTNPGFQWINLSDFTYDDPEADLSLTKSVSSATPAVGENVVFTLQVSNAGPDNAERVEVTDLLPAGFTYVSDNSGGNYTPGTGVWDVGTVTTSTPRSIQITATVNPNGPYINSAEITAAGVTDSDSTPGNNIPSEDDQDSATVTPAEIGVAKQLTTGPTSNGDGTFMLVYTVTLENTGATSLSSVQAVDNLATTFTGATGFVVDSVTSGTLAVNGAYNGVGDTSLLAGTDTLAIAASGQIVVTVTVAPGANLGPYNNAATGSGQSPTGATASDNSTDGALVDPDANGDPSDNSVTTPVSFTESPQIGAAKSISAAPLSNGDGTFTLTYTVTIENSGDVALNGVQVVDDLSTTFTGATGFSVDAVTSSTLTVNGGYDGSGNTDLLAGTDTLAIGATETIAVTVTVTPGADLGPYDNAATASGTSLGGTPVSDLSTAGTDPDPEGDGPGDNVAPTPVSFTESPQIGAAKSISAAPASNGDGTFTLTYTVTVENSGDVALNGVQVVDDLSTTFTGATGFSVDAVTSSTLTVNGGYDGSGNTDLLAGTDTLAIGATETIAVTVTVTPGADLGPYDNAATASGTSLGGTPVSDLSTAGTDPDPEGDGPGDNVAPTPVSFTESPQIGAAKSISAGPASNGDGTFTLTYTVTVENSGDVALNGVQVVDDLSTTFTGATGFSVDAVTSSTLTVNGGYDGSGNTDLLAGTDTLAIGATETIAVTVTVTPGADLGPYDNAATASGTSLGGTPVSDLSTAGTDPDPEGDGPGDNIAPTPVSFTESPQIGAAKSISAGPASNGDGTFTLTYTVTVENSGDVALNGVQVVDDLSTTFTGATGFSVDAVTSSTLTVNGGYDGSGNTDLLAGTDTLAIGATETIAVTVTVTPGADLGPYDNAATASGTSLGGTPVSDLSTAGTDPDPEGDGPGDNVAPTPVSFTESPQIGAAKSISAGPASNGDGTFSLQYIVTVENTGDVNLNNVQTVDDLSTTFAGATGFIVDSISSPTLTENTGYDGNTDTNLLAGTDTFTPGFGGIVIVDVTVTPGANLGPFNNTATASATSAGGTPVTDDSTNGAQVDPDNDGNPGNNSDPTPVTFAESPEIGTAKSISASPASNGDGTFTLTYTVTIENSGDVALNGVQVVDDLSTTFAGATGFSVDAVTSSTLTVNGGYDGSGNTDLLTGADTLAIGSTETIAVTVTVTPGADLGPYDNAATASGTSLGGTPVSDLSTAGTDPDPEGDGPGDNVAPTPVSFTESPEIGAAKSISAGPASNGDGTFTLTYTVTVENSGDVALNGVQVVDDLSTTFAGATGFAVDSVTSVNFAVNTGYDGNGNTDLLAGTDTLLPAGTGTIDFTVTVTPGANLGPYDNAATASGTSLGGTPVSDLSTAGTDPDPEGDGPGDNVAPTPVSFTEAPEIGTAKSISVGPTSNGDGTFRLTYTVTVGNSGDVQLQNVQVVDDLAATFTGATGFIVDSVTSGDFTVNPGYNGNADTNLLAGSDTLAAPGTGTIAVTVTVTPGANLGPYNNAATASGTSSGGTPVSDLSTSGVNPDPDNNGDPGDNGDPTPVSFSEAPAVGAAKALTSGPVNNGDGTYTLAYTIVAENTGDVTINSLQITENLAVTFATAGGFSVDSVTSPVFALNAGFDGTGDTGLLAGSDSLGVGASGTVVVTVTVTPGANLGPYDNTASVSGLSPAGTPVSDVSTDGVDPDPDNNGSPGDNSDVTPVSFTEAPQIGVAKTVSAGPMANGDGTFSLTYSLFVENSGDARIDAVQVSDDLATTFGGATGFSVDSVTSAQFVVNNIYDGGAMTNLLDAGNALDAGASGTINVVVTVTPGASLGPFDNTATASGTSTGGVPVSDVSTDGTDPDPDNNGDPGNNSDPTPVAFVEMPVIGVAKSVSNGPTNNGDGTFSLNYTLVVENLGDVPLSAVQVVDNLSVTFAGATSVFVNSAFSPEFSINSSYDGSTDANLLTGANVLVAGGSGSISIDVTVTPGANLGPYNNAAVASGQSPAGAGVTDTSTSGTDPDPDMNGDPGDNSDPTPVSFSEAPQIGAAKTVLSAPVSNGDGSFTLSYRISVENSGDVPLSTVQVQDNLATSFSGATFTVDATTSTDFAVSPSFDGSTDPALLAGTDTLAAGATGTVDVTVTVMPGANLGPYDNTALASGMSPAGTPVSDDSTDGADPDPDNNGNPGDNGDPTPVSFVEMPSIGAAKSVSVGPASNGDGTFTLAYTIVVENTGDADLTAVQVVDDTNATFASAVGFTVDAVTSADFAVNPGYDGNTVTDLLAGSDTLAIGASGSIVVTVTVTPGTATGPFNNSATASGMSAGAGVPVSDVSQSGSMTDPDGNGDPTDNNDPTPVSFSEMPQIGAAKAVTAGPVNNGDGTFTLTYLLTMENSGDVQLSVVNFEENLATVFAAATAFSVDSLTSADFTVNPSFDGVGDVNLLGSAEVLNAGESRVATLIVTVTPGTDPGPYSNSVTAVGQTPTGTPVSDVSGPGTDPDPEGDGPGNNDTPTNVLFLLGTDATVDITDMSVPGDTLTVTVTDADLNGNPSVADTVVVVVVNNDTGESETVTLTETGPNTGVFVGTVGTVFGTSPGADNDGVFNTEIGHTLTVTYNDALTSTGGTALLTDDDIVGNTPPDAIDDSAATPIDTPVAIPVLANDADPNGHDLTVTGVTQPANGTVTFTPDGTVIYTPDPGFTGTDTFTYTIDDGFGGTDTATVTVVVDNDTPTAVADSAVTPPSTPVTIDILANDTDPNDDPLSIVPGSITDPANGTVVVNPDGTVTYTPDPGFTGTDTFTYQITDPDGNTDTAIVTVVVSDSIPQAVDDVDTTPLDTPITVSVLDNDSDPMNDSLTVDGITQPANGTAVLNPDGTVTYTPNPGFTGVDTFTYTISDPDGNTDVAAVTITVVGEEPPVAEDDSGATPIDTPIAIPVFVNDSDPNNQTIVIDSITQPANGTVTFTPDGTVVYTPNPGFTGTDTFTYTIINENGLTDIATVTVVVDNDTPTAVADSAVTPPSTPVVINALANDTDPNDDTLSIVAGSVTDPANGSVVVNADGTVTYTPDAGFTGTDTFTYQITDPDGNTDTAIVTVIVSDAIPQAIDDVDTTTLDTPITVAVLDNDTDPNGDALTVNSITQPANGTAVLNPDGTVTYTPDAGFVGVDTFTYTITDADGNTDVAAVTITVQAVANVSGNVWFDADADDVFDADEDPVSGWTVELVRDGSVVATTTSAADGSYAFNGVPPGPGYSIQLRHPESNSVFGLLDNVTLPPGTSVVDQNLPVDPSGVVYDSVARTPIAGTTVSLTGPSGTALPVECLLPDQQGQITGADGFYRFDLVLGANPACPSGGTYMIAMTPPATGYLPAPSTLIPPVPGALALTGLPDPFAIAPTFTAPQDGDSTLHYFSFVIANGDPDAINNHLPLDPVSAFATIRVTKRADRDRLVVGDLASYTVTVENTGSRTIAGIDLSDRIPAGFSYVDGSARLESGATLNVSGQRPVVFGGISLDPGQTDTLRYMLRVGAGVTHGQYVNTVSPLVAGQAVGNDATATVTIASDPDFEDTTIVGKVFNDIDGDGWQDDGEEGIPGVRLATVEGLIIETDVHGRYHIAAVDGGMMERGRNFIVKVDAASLPDGVQFTSENPRVQRITQGLMNRFDFGVRLPGQAAGEACCDWIEVKISEIFFDQGSDTVRSEYLPLIEQLADRLRAADGGVLTIEGGADAAETSCPDTVVRQQVGEYTLTPRFKARKTTLSEDDKAGLDRIAYEWRDATDIQIISVGHTDNIRIAPKNRHEFANNKVLSEARAQTVANYLRDGLGASVGQVVVEGRGPEQPAASNATAAGRAENRRVELTIKGVRASSAAPDCDPAADDLGGRRARKVYELLKRFLGDDMIGNVEIRTGAANATPQTGQPTAQRQDRHTNWIARAATATLSLIAGPVHAADATCSVDLCEADGGYAIQVIEHNGPRPASMNDTAFAAQDAKRVDVTGRFRVKMSGGGVLWATEDPTTIDPRLALHVPDLVAVEGGRVVAASAFHAYSNYAAFIDAAQIEIYHGADIDRIQPLATLPFEPGLYRRVAWDGRTTGRAVRPGDELAVRVRVRDKAGHADLTDYRYLRAVTPAEYSMAGGERELSTSTPGKGAAATPGTAGGINNNAVLVLRPPVRSTSSDTKAYTLTPHFDTRKTDLKPENRAALDQIIAQWQGYSNVRIQAIGHTDNIRIAPKNRHEFANNQVLSEARARSVVQYVARALGVSEQSAIVIGRGPAEPVASNNTAAGRAKNRRTELTISGERVEQTTQGAAAMQLVDPASGIAVPVTDSLDRAEYLLRTRRGDNRSGNGEGTGSGGRGPGARGDLSARSSTHALGAIYGHNHLVRQTIPVYGSRVRLHGDGVAPAAGLNVNGEPVPLDVSGQFAVEYMLPVGEHAFDLEFLDNTGRVGDRARVPVKVDGKHMFIVALADLTLSNNDVSGSIEPLSADDRFAEDFLVEGRLALYLKGKVKGKYLVTAQLDTTEEQLDDILGNLGDKNPQDVFRRLDPDRYYPVYGDDSTTYSDTDSMGRLYLRADWDKSTALWGNFHTDLTGTEFAQYNRSLYGAKLSHQSLATTARGDAKTDVTAFVSEAQTALGHSEFIGTGGSLYYLRHTDVLPGSDKVRIEIRDRDSERVRDNLVLTRGVDYEIDEIQGRIILARPLMQVAQLLKPGLIKDSPLDGDMPVLLADYEYIPDAFSADKVTVGARGKQWLGENLSIGGTYVDESRVAEDYTLAGVDVTYRLGEASYVKGEFAGSESSQTDRFFSNDGGLSFETLTEDTVGRDGDAWGVEARINSREVFATEREVAAGVWYRRTDDNFSVARRDEGVDTTEYGVELVGQLSDRIELSGIAAIVDRENAVEDTRISVRADYLLNDRSTVSGEVRHISESVAGPADNDGALAGLRYSYRLTPAVELYAGGQFTLSNDNGRYDNNDMATVGGTWQVGDRINLNGEYSSGHRGDGALLGLDYRINDDHQIYGTYTQSADRSDTLEGTQFAIGHRSRLSDQTTVFSERQFAERDGQSGLMHVFGLDFTPLPGWTAGMSYQRGDLTTRDGLIDRDSATGSIGYRGDKLRATSKIEYRNEDGVVDLRQWLTSNRMDYKFSDDWRLLGRLNYSETEDQRAITGDDDARFVEGAIGAAFRPTRSDRLNLLTKYTYLYDLPGQSQTRSGTDQRSHILSLEGIYRLNPQWDIGGKLARRKSELRTDRDSGQWFASTADFAALRGRYHLIRRWDGVIEYRWLNVDEADSTRTGWLVALDRHFGEHLKLGLGYNFTDFSDDLTNLDYDHKGFFLNALGKY